MSELFAIAEKNFPHAEQLIRQAQRGLPHKAVDIFDLCLALDFPLAPHKDWRESLSAGIVTDKQGRFIIHYNSRHPRTRQRFTLAHEVAHCLLHAELLRYEERYYENVLLRGSHNFGAEGELEASTLAGEILMPDTVIQSYIDKNSGAMSIPELAKLFEVSWETMSVRLGIPMDI